MRLIPSSLSIEATAFDYFLEAMPEACNEILSNYVTSNGKSLGAIDLEISFNYELFFEEYSQESEIALLKKICDVDQVNIRQIYRISNIPFSQWIVKCHRDRRDIIFYQNHLQRVILKHPVCESFLHMKWLLVKRIFDMYIFSYVIFLASLSVLVFIQYSPSFSGEHHLSTRTR